MEVKPMNRPETFSKAVWLTTLILVFARPGFAQSGQPGERTVPRFTRAVVVDDRLSALREEADQQSPVKQRLRLGRKVYIFGSKGGTPVWPRFYRVAVTRRTRGWVHHQAIAVPGRRGEDERVIRLIEETTDSLDKIALCRIFMEHFNHSPLAARALLHLAEESDRAADALTRRARKRLADLKKDDTDVDLRDFYLNDPGLDRYSKLRVRFDFEEATASYAYDGQAYRDIIRRFPASEEAARSRKRLMRQHQPANAP